MPDYSIGDNIFGEFGDFFHYKLVLYGNLWQKPALHTCQKLQNLVFPDGILWDKEIGNYRTIKTNLVLELIAKISSTYKNEDEGGKPSSVALCG